MSDELTMTDAVCTAYVDAFVEEYPKGHSERGERIAQGISDFHAWLAAHDAEAEARGAKGERARIVALLYDTRTEHLGTPAFNAFTHAVVAIESGEHLRKDGSDV